MGALHEMRNAWSVARSRRATIGDGSSANTLEAELAFDSERPALPKALHLLRNAELSCICIALWVRPNV